MQLQRPEAVRYGPEREDDQGTWAQLSSEQRDLADRSSGRAAAGLAVARPRHLGVFVEDVEPRIVGRCQIAPTSWLLPLGSWCVDPARGVRRPHPRDLYPGVDSVVLFGARRAGGSIRPPLAVRVVGEGRDGASESLTDRRKGGPSEGGTPGVGIIRVCGSCPLRVTTLSGVPRASALSRAATPGWPSSRRRGSEGDPDPEVIGGLPGVLFGLDAVQPELDAAPIGPE